MSPSPTQNGLRSPARCTPLRSHTRSRALAELESQSRQRIARRLLPPTLHPKIVSAIAGFPSSPSTRSFPADPHDCSPAFHRTELQPGRYLEVHRACERTLAAALLPSSNCD